jgi:hypothetical protein
MRVEGQYAAGFPTQPSFVMCHIDQPVVAAMHAVEIADSHDGAAQFSGHGMIGAADAEAWRSRAGPS